jgi:4-carboxymuconolactone decarboxylase
MSDDEALVHDFCTEFNTHSAVSDNAFERARTRFREQTVVDLLALNGYYTLLAMMLNVARTPAPDSAAPPLLDLPTGSPS